MCWSPYLPKNPKVLCQTWKFENSLKRTQKWCPDFNVLWPPWPGVSPPPALKTTKWLSWVPVEVNPKPELKLVKTQNSWFDEFSSKLRNFRFFIRKVVKSNWHWKLRIQIREYLEHPWYFRGKNRQFCHFNGFVFLRLIPVFIWRVFSKLWNVRFLLRKVVKLNWHQNLKIEESNPWKSSTSLIFQGKNR